MERGIAIMLVALTILGFAIIAAAPEAAAADDGGDHCTDLCVMELPCPETVQCHLDGRC